MAVEGQGYEFHAGTSMSSGSTDMGDLACVMPMIHGYAPGAVGTAHGKDYYIEDTDLACVASAEVQLAMLEALLDNGAELAYEIIEGYEAPFASAKEYIEYLDSLRRSGDRISYGDKGAEVIL
jgi:hypothetical protein